MSDKKITQEVIKEFMLDGNELFKELEELIQTGNEIVAVIRVTEFRKFSVVDDLQVADYLVIYKTGN